MAAARREASESSRRDGSEQLYTLANGVKGGVDGKVSLAALPSLDARLEPNEMCLDKFYQALKSDELYEVVVLRPKLELCSSFLIDEAILDDIRWL